MFRISHINKQKGQLINQNLDLETKLEEKTEMIGKLIFKRINYRYLM